MYQAPTRCRLAGIVREGPARCPRGVGLCAAALAAALAFACATEEPEPPSEPQPRPVQYVEVTASSGARMRTFAGFAKADVRAEIAFRVPGTVQRMHVDEGTVLEQGDLIAELDPVDLEITVREIEASVAEARADLSLADSEFRRVQNLYERENVSLGDFESALAGRESAQARSDAMQQRLLQARHRIDYARLRAPERCGIVQVLAEEGESVQAGDAIVEIITGERPQVEVAVPEMLVGEITQGKRATVRFPAFPDRSLPGRVKTVGVVPAEGVTAYPVTIELDQLWEDMVGPGGEVPVRPGMAVEAMLQFGDEEAGFRHVVPTAAVLASGQDRYVYVAEPDTAGGAVARRRAVEVGDVVTGGLELLSGLADGDRVITAGLNQIQEGRPVRLLPSR